MTCDIEVAKLAHKYNHLAKDNNKIKIDHLRDPKGELARAIIDELVHAALQEDRRNIY